MRLGHTLITPPPTTSGSKDTLAEVGGEIIHPIGRKAAKKKAKEKVENPMLDLMIKQLLVLGTSNAEKNDIFE